MEETKNQAHIPPVQLSEESRFDFICDSKNACFTHCCRGLTIVLTPYDILRLKKRMGLSSGEFLSLYSVPELLEKTDLPVPVLRMMDDAERTCPFVREDGCLVYEDRPAACRYYPIGHGTLRPKEADASQRFYFLVREPHCKGFDREKNWSVGEWRKDQGVDVYDEMNAGWANLVVRKRSFPDMIKLTPDAKKMFFLGSYDLDRFRGFVFESSFLDVYDVDAARVEAMRNDDTALMKFGFDWLEGVLFKQGPVKLNPEKAQARMEAKHKAVNQPH